jgi:ABC-type polysaccharide/polyol phosphate export permease
MNTTPTGRTMAGRLARDIHEIITEQIAHRELLVRMTHRDLLLRYKQTVMGFGWAIFMPVVNTLVFSVIFMRVAPINTGMPYPLYAYSGLLAWNFFASSLRFAVNSLTGNANLVTKIYFPREIFPLSAVTVTFVDSIIGAIVLAGMMVYYRVAVSPVILMLPVVIVVETAFTCAMALALAMANLFYRDIKYLFEIVMTVWMFATSVVYPVDLAGYRLGIILRLNPMVAIIEAFRNIVLRGQPPDPGQFIVPAVVSIVAFVASAVIFHRMEYKFAENI